MSVVVRFAARAGSILAAPLLVALAVVGSPSAAAQTAFEGTINFRVFDEGRPKGEMAYRVKGGKIRLDSRFEKRASYLLLELDAGTMATVLPSLRVYLRLALDSADSKAERGSARPLKVTKVGRRETIAGYPCDHYLIGDAQDTDVCAATGLGFFGIAGSSLADESRMLPAAVAAEYRELRRRFADGFQALKLEQVDGTRRRLIMQAESVERARLDPSLFVIPPGYRPLELAPIGVGLPPLPIPPK